MDCSEVRPLLGLERDLPPELRLAVREHLAGCQGCSLASRQADDTSRLLGALTEPDVRPSQVTLRAIEARLAAPLAAPRRGLWATATAFAVALLLIVLLVLASPRIGAGKLGQLLATLLPGQSLGPRLYLATDRDPSFNLGSPQITILDPTTLAPLFSTTAGDDTILSADQKHMYVASTSQITAIDVISQRELWRLPLDHLLAYIGGLGPSSLALAPDGGELYVLSYNSGDSSAPLWLQVVDTATGRLRPNIVPLPTCVDASPSLLSPGSGDRVYVVCSWSVLAINTRSQVVEQTTSLLALTSQMVDAVLSRDGGLIYIATLNRELALLDTATGTLNPHATAARPPAVTGNPGYGALALSADGNTLLALDTVQSQSGTDVAADLYFYDTRSLALLRQVRVNRPLQSTALAISADSRTIYSATGPAGNMPFGADTIVEIDAATGAITSEYPHTGEHILRLWLMPGGR